MRSRPPIQPGKEEEEEEEEEGEGAQICLSISVRPWKSGTFSFTSLASLAVLFCVWVLLAVVRQRIGCCLELVLFHWGV